MVIEPSFESDLEPIHFVFGGQVVAIPTQKQDFHLRVGRGSRILSVVHDSTPKKLKAGVLFLIWRLVIDGRRVLGQIYSRLHCERRRDTVVHTWGN